MDNTSRASPAPSPERGERREDCPGAQGPRRLLWTRQLDLGPQMKHLLETSRNGILSAQPDRGGFERRTTTPVGLALSSVPQQRRNVLISQPQVSRFRVEKHTNSSLGLPHRQPPCQHLCVNPLPAHSSLLCKCEYGDLKRHVSLLQHRHLTQGPGPPPAPLQALELQDECLSHNYCRNE